MNYLERDDSDEEYSTDQAIEMNIEWIETLARNDYPKHMKSMRSGKGGFCCLGVARNELSLGGADEDVLEGYEEADLRLNWEPDTLEGCRSLASLNDDKRVPHTEIAKALITDAHEYFTDPEVAEAIQRHFFLNEDAS